MDDTLNNNIENQNTNWNIGGFDINKKKSEIIQELNIPNYKDGIDLVFEQNPELINIIINTLKDKEKVRLYRIENKNIPYDETREWIVSKKEIIGCFFTDNIQTLSNYIKKNQSKPWIELVYVDIPKNQLENFHVSNNEYAQNMDVENDNRIIPTTVNRNYLDLSSLSKVTGNFLSFKNTQQELNQTVSNLPKDQPINNNQVKQIYAEYLTTIFPESKVRNVTYHGTSSTFEDEDFDKSKLWSSTDNITNKLWFYFVPDKRVSDIFIKWKIYKRENGKIKVILPENAKTLCVLLNIKNPEYIEGDIFQKYAEANKMPPLKLDGDSIVITPQTDNILPEFSCDNYVIFNSDQIHVLGSRKDIQQLKEWLNSRK